MPGYGPSSPKSHPLAGLAQMSSAEIKAERERREQGRRDGEERMRTRRLLRENKGRWSYLKACDAYSSPAGHGMRAHRLVQAKDCDLKDARAHIVPSGSDRDVLAICGVGPGRESGGWGWSKTLSESTCLECLLRSDTTYDGYAFMGTGDRVQCGVPGYLFPRPVPKKPGALEWYR